MDLEKKFYNPYIAVLNSTVRYYYFIGGGLPAGKLLEFANKMKMWLCIKASGAAQNVIGLYVWKLAWLMFYSLGSESVVEAFEKTLPPEIFIYKFLISCTIIDDFAPAIFILRQIRFNHKTVLFYHYQSTSPSQFIPVNYNSRALVGIFKTKTSCVLFIAFNPWLENNLTYCSRGILLTPRGKYAIRALRLTPNEIYVKTAKFRLNWEKSRFLIAAEIFSIL